MELHAGLLKDGGPMAAGGASTRRDPTTGEGRRIVFLIAAAHRGSAY
jgi:hypothetical protein